VQTQDQRDCLQSNAEKHNTTLDWKPKTFRTNKHKQRPKNATNKLTKNKLQKNVKTNKQQTKLKKIKIPPNIVKTGPDP